MRTEGREEYNEENMGRGRRGEQRELVGRNEAGRNRRKSARELGGRRLSLGDNSWASAREHFQGRQFSKGKHEPKLYQRVPEVPKAPRTNTFLHIFFPCRSYQLIVSMWSAHLAHPCLGPPLPWSPASLPPRLSPYPVPPVSFPSSSVLPLSSFPFFPYFLCPSPILFPLFLPLLPLLP